ncbi:hypothetical protein [Neoroseomonas lacus]|uniref:Uncharacterized protein n=1 Tax=Neoroseomonas lacus TaxID=287609 RepID=A0A917NTQ5_9PROT|nr:hypothetical protein [Neoroseomonas lacus]GGJ24263.1 hypothetical protein GCM10011320_34400 [Neoroseomonas lacus]
MSASLTIRHLTLDFHAPPGGAGRQARDSAEAIRTELPDRLRDALSLPDDDGVLLLRRLAIDLTIPAGASGSAVAARLAEALAAGLRRAAADGRAVVRFDSVAGHSAAFLAALVDGSAWGRWWFVGFDGVRALPLPAAIRTVLLRDPAIALAMLAAMPAAVRAQVLAALGSAEARRVIDVLRAREPATAPDAAWAPVVAALDAAGAEPEPIAVLALAAAAELVPGRLRVAECLARLTTWMEAAPDAAEAWLATGTIPAGLEPATATLLAATPAAGRAALAARRQALPQAAPRPAVALHVPLGGYALLCPGLLDWPIEADVAAWPDLDDTPAADVLRLLTLAAAAGPARAGSLWREAAFREVFAVAPRTVEADLRAWARRIGPARWARLAAPSGETAAAKGVGLPVPMLPGRIARATLARCAGGILADFARRLPGFASASPGFLRANLLGRGATFLLAPDSIQVRLERPPLDVLLSITGLGDRRASLPDGRALILARAP